jgi:ribosomal protein S18 acetylase RimI-like enzyme
MSIVNPVRRIASFYRMHGFRSTMDRAYTALRRLTYFGRMILYSCPLPLEQSLETGEISIEPVDAATISNADYEWIISVWNPELRARQVAARFEAGSELWLAKINGRPAGYGWTIQGRTLDPYFFPLQPRDAHLYDFYVDPEFRGRGINVILVMEILTQLSKRSVCVAFIECAAWNDAQIRSLSKTAFRRNAEATQIKFLGRQLIIWR